MGGFFVILHSSSFFNEDFFVIFSLCRPLYFFPLVPLSVHLFVYHVVIMFSFPYFYCVSSPFYLCNSPFAMSSLCFPLPFSTVFLLIFVFVLFWKIPIVPFFFFFSALAHLKDFWRKEAQAQLNESCPFTPVHFQCYLYSAPIILAPFCFSAVPYFKPESFIHACVIILVLSFWFCPYSNIFLHISHIFCLFFFYLK